MTNYEGTKTDTARGGIASWPPYHWIDEPVEPILKDFWEAIYDQSDIQKHELFIKMLSLRREGKLDSEIGRTLGMNNNIGKYLSGKKKGFITHLRVEHDRLGRPADGFKWLPLRLKPRGTPDTAWIQVPAKIREFSDLTSVLDQLKPTEDSIEIMKQFEYRTRDELLAERPRLFGFYSGTVLGDAGKPVKGTTRFRSMTVALTLSKDKANSYRFGEFSSLATNASLGLSMHRISDAPVSEHRFTKSECYRWLSPASPLVAWSFKVCLGLQDGQLTTYDPIVMDWLLRAPKEFKVHFLQGLAESDGWVDSGRDKVVFVSSPNEKLLMSLLSDLSIPCIPLNQPPITRLEVETELGLSLPIFNPRINSHNYKSLVIMANAKRFPERIPLPDWFLEQIRPILLACDNYSQACLEIARTTGYKISGQSVKKYADALRQ